MSLRKQYKRTMTAVGAVLILWVAFFKLFTLLPRMMSHLLSPLLNEVALEVTVSIVYGAAYMGAFMLSAFLFGLARKTEPMRLEIKLHGDSLAWIFGGIACLFVFSYLNGIFMNLISIPDTGDIIKEAHKYMADYSIVLQFITVAIVPAFCEEFLFRGVILSNLMPYGKGLAIIVSSVLFGLMHGNFYQFLYTMAAGMILGLLYVLTDSIWCSVLMHLINNSLSVLQLAIYERFAEEVAAKVWMMAEMTVFLIGIVSIAYLITKYGKRQKAEKYAELGTVREIDMNDTVKGFFNPAVIVFAVYSVAEAVMRLIYG